MITLDLSNIVLTVLSGTIIFFLQRELKRQDSIRLETLKLIENTNNRLDGHSEKISKLENKSAKLEGQLELLVNRRRPEEA